MVQIGKIISVHGVKGDIIIAHQLPTDFDMEELEAIMIEINPKSYIPFFIDEIAEISDKEIQVKLEEVKTREKAIKLLNKNIFAPPTLQIDIESENEWVAMVGFTLYDEQKIEVGKIDDVYINGVQVLLSVFVNEDEKLIPIADELIIDLNTSNKTLTLKIAEGLLEL